MPGVSGAAHVPELNQVMLFLGGVYVDHLEGSIGFHREAVKGAHTFQLGLYGEIVGTRSGVS